MESTVKENAKKSSEKYFKLNQEEKSLFSQTRKLYETILSYEMALWCYPEDCDSIYTSCMECADTAYKLCQILARNRYKLDFYEFFFLYNSRYHKYIHDTSQQDLIKNVEELLFFIQCNLDTEGVVDRTKDIEFSLRISLGDSSMLRIWLTCIEHGWQVKYREYGTRSLDAENGYYGEKPIETDTSCTALIENFLKDKIYIPMRLTNFFEWLWQECANGLSPLDLKQKLDAFVDCLSLLGNTSSEWVKTMLPKETRTITSYINGVHPVYA